MNWDFELGTTWPIFLCALVTVCCFIYLWELTRSYTKGRRSYGILIADLDGIEEGFANKSDSSAETEAKTTGLDQRIDDACYDAFYAKVYDQLVQPIARAPMETKVALEWMASEEGGKRSPENLRVADIGCGTGLHAELFAQESVRSVVGFDKSPAMFAEAKARHEKMKTSDSKHVIKNTNTDVTFLVGDATVATMASAAQFDLITMYYFTVYMIPERTQMLRNIFLWLDTGGMFMVHIVNKHKLDPILEAASPWVGFSAQKYADERITKSQVFFDKFDYEGSFDLHGSRATYEEVFKFKNGKIRRHEQRLWMPDISAIVSEIENIGFRLKHHVDLTPIGYEYQYLFIFAK